MTHKTEKFTFAGNGGKVVTFINKKYCFEVENLFKEMIGEDKFNSYQKDSSVDLELSQDSIEKYFPLLLDEDESKSKTKSKSKIDWDVQDYDEILRVVTFFLGYRKNAALRQLESQKETIASILEMMKKILNLKPEDLSNKEKLESILGISLPEVPASLIS